jgi:hypothetical protein
MGFAGQIRRIRGPHLAHGRMFCMPTLHKKFTFIQVKVKYYVAVNDI